MKKWYSYPRVTIWCVHLASLDELVLEIMQSRDKLRVNRTVMTFIVERAHGNTSEQRNAASVSLVSRSIGYGR